MNFYAYMYYTIHAHVCTCTVVEITRGLWSISMHFIWITDHFQEWLVGVTKHVVSCTFYFSVVKREACLIIKRSQDESGTCSTIKKRRVEYFTFQKWQRDLNREYQTITWLDCSSEKERGKKVVVQLKCKMCSDFVEKKIKGREKL